MTDYPPSAPINEVLKPANPHSDLEIVGELRKWATIYRGTYGAQVCTQAADEIERLRSFVQATGQLAACVMEIERNGCKTDQVLARLARKEFEAAAK